MEPAGRRWSYETLVCGLAGHVTPAASVRELRPQDARLGIDVGSGRRLCRCLRCDAWVEGAIPAAPGREVLPEVDALELPRRGKLLREALVLRLIAINRGVHAVLFGALAVALVWFDLKLGVLRSGAEAILEALTAALSDVGPNSSRSFLARQLTGFLHLQRHTVTILALTAIAYCIVEGVEAVGLWLERRWAAYLTVLATAGFLPFEILELHRRVTALRIGALAINLAILAYLLYRERLFGIRGGAPAKAAEQIDRRALFGLPAPPHGGALAPLPGGGSTQGP